MKAKTSQWDSGLWESGELPAHHAGGAVELVELDPDHPGFRDAAYRARRNAIAASALAFSTGESVPDVEYVDEEHAVWRQVQAELDPRHAELACTELNAASALLAMNRERIPQLSELNPRLRSATRFRMEPVAGLVSGRVFLSYLARRVFLSTQYIRHASRPLYTPEPDVIHELIGHAASLTDPQIADLSQAFGEAATFASEEEVLRLERVYWYTLEFGVALEDERPRAYGAGLLSSIGELERVNGGAELVEWDLERMAETPYDPTDYQPQLFVAPSFCDVVDGLGRWLEGGGWRRS